jgi:type IV pilus assembly protein PilX
MKQAAFLTPPRGRQEGAALIVVLMLLVIVTVLGIASMRGAIMQERMAANIMTRGMAFQVAEAGLRQAEVLARDGTITFPTGGGCAGGRCADASWDVAGFWNDGGAGYQTGSAVEIGGGRTISPKFVIENFGTSAVTGSGTSSCIDLSKPCFSGVSQSVYRITSYAAAPNGAEVILQSLYRR